MNFSVDPLVTRFLKSRSYALGVGVLGQCPASRRYELLDALSDACVVATQRRVLSIKTMKRNDESLDVEPNREKAFDCVTWLECGESRSDKLHWNRQLSQWSTWRREYGLIVMDLGTLLQPSHCRSLGLCDGIVIHMLESLSEREAVRALRSLQTEGPPVLGAWSIANTDRAIAA